MKKATKGNKVEVHFGGRKKATFTAGGRKRYLVEHVYGSGANKIGVVYCNGRVRLADGTEMFAILGIDESSSGEHCDTLVFTPDGGLVEPHAELERALGKCRDDIFPYTYTYDANLRCRHDHHIGDNGWSK